MKPYILCAAIHFNDNKTHESQPINIATGFIICGRMHNNVLTTLKALNIEKQSLGESIQGFITSDNRFVDRVEAAQIAFSAYQVEKCIDELNSSDLYTDVIE